MCVRGSGIEEKEKSEEEDGKTEERGRGKGLIYSHTSIVGE